MKCPSCRARLRVLFTRDKGPNVRRVRICDNPACRNHEQRLSTVEMLEASYHRFQELLERLGTVQRGTRPEKTGSLVDGGLDTAAHSDNLSRDEK